MSREKIASAAEAEAKQAFIYLVETRVPVFTIEDAVHHFEEDEDLETAISYSKRKLPEDAPTSIGQLLFTKTYDRDGSATYSLKLISAEDPRSNVGGFFDDTHNTFNMAEFGIMHENVSAIEANPLLSRVRALENTFEITEIEYGTGPQRL